MGVFLCLKIDANCRSYRIMNMKRFALLSALMLFTALPAIAQPIESEVLPPVQMAPQSKAPPGVPTSLPAQAPAKPKNSSGYLPMNSASPADAPSPPIGDPSPKETAAPDTGEMATDDSGMAGTSDGTSAYDLGAPTSAPPKDITSAAPPPSNHSDPLMGDTTPIRNWQENMPPSTRGDDPALAAKKFCNLQVSFTSIGTGIDSKTAEKIKMYLVANPDILTYTENKWGREGEFDYCVDIKEHKNRAKIYTDIKRLLPPAAAKKPPTNIIGDGFEPISTYR